METQTVMGSEVDRLVARANAYSTLARALALPSTFDQELVANLREHFRPFGDEVLGLAASVATTMESVLAEPEPCSIAFAKLFLGPFEIDAPPYASLYLDPERRLMGPVSLAVAEAYAEAGLGPAAAGPKDAPDHIAHELEFMYFVAFEAARTGDPIWAERRSRFWTTHLQPWLSEFARRMAVADRHPLYTALASLLARFAADEASAEAR